ncbi:putative helicase MAGATAMA 3 isoform X1 [Cinnamomum micranthum f. kanehirae]|uniref:Putative helicase MAGATAMA 3 isoform X1 n=1 Tax=Cinnamomum micranthum f. kanehirae TaxID=337451 RepID=A0A443Q241_9MAGN|nr:putative helicase MAGATAMA 3 isoform X1 [Cinnamomum micranthum f. kanehirae]
MERQPIQRKDFAAEMRGEAFVHAYVKTMLLREEALDVMEFGGELSALRQRPDLPMHEKYSHWGKASPWLTGTNPRDLIVPEDGDDGFYPTTGNELKPEVITSNRKYRVHVLVCAPSNSALDEIVLRLINTARAFGASVY